MVIYICLCNDNKSIKCSNIGLIIIWYSNNYNIIMIVRIVDNKESNSWYKRE